MAFLPRDRWARKEPGPVSAALQGSGGSIPICLIPTCITIIYLLAVEPRLPSYHLFTSLFICLPSTYSCFTDKKLAAWEGEQTAETLLRGRTEPGLQPLSLFATPAAASGKTGLA